jgi:phenylacetate-CoA ligase
MVQSTGERDARFDVFMLATEELITEAGQDERLRTVLGQYLERIPLYRKAHLGNGPLEMVNIIQALRRLPLLTKQDMHRNFPANFLGPGVELEPLIENEEIELERTSGTTEARIPLLLPRGWWAEQERRALELNSLVVSVLRSGGRARRATLNSPVCSSEVCFTGTPSRNERVVGETLFLALSKYPFLWGEADLGRMVAEVLEWAPQFLDLDPVYGVAFALYCEKRKIRLPWVRFIICTYEFASVLHRRILQRVFRVPVFNLYGSTETGHLLMEDESGFMRPSLETAFLEVIYGGKGLLPLADNDSDSHEEDQAKCASTVSEPGDGIDTGGDGRIAELVVTTLTNPIMPLVRYRIGDLVECSRGAYQTTYVVHGRVADAFVTGDHQRITTLQVDQCFADIEGIAHYQLIERIGRPWLLRFIPDGAGPGRQALSDLCQRLTERLSLKEPIELQATDILLPENSGKFRLGYPAPAGVKSRMDTNERP